MPQTFFKQRSEYDKLDIKNSVGSQVLLGQRCYYLFLMDPYLTFDSFCLLSRIWLTISTSFILQKDQKILYQLFSLMFFSFDIPMTKCLKLNTKCQSMFSIKFLVTGQFNEKNINYTSKQIIHSLFLICTYLICWMKK